MYVRVLSLLNLLVNHLSVRGQLTLGVTQLSSGQLDKSARQGSFDPERIYSQAYTST